MSIFYLSYLLIGAVIILIWLIFPKSLLFLFLIIAAYHFGKEDSEFINQKEKFVKGYRGQFTAVDISMNLPGDTQVGFKWDNNSNAYELVTDLDLWKFEIPVERFISKVTQMYAYQTIISKTQDDGYQIVEQKNKNDGSIELVLTKWEN